MGVPAKGGERDVRGSVGGDRILNLAYHEIITRAVAIQRSLGMTFQNRGGDAVRGVLQWIAGRRQKSSTSSKTEALEWRMQNLLKAG